jgi:hypothetical protein
MEWRGKHLLCLFEGSWERFWCIIFILFSHIYIYCENINFIDVKRLFKRFVVKLRLILRILPCQNKCLLSCKFLKKSSSLVPLPLQVSNIISFELFLILICTSCVDYPQNGIGYLGKKKCCQIWYWIGKTIMHLITSSASKSFFEHEIGLVLTYGIFSCKVNLSSFFFNPIFFNTIIIYHANFDWFNFFCK